MNDILVVDDDPAVLAAVASLLEYLKHRVLKVNCARDALAILRARHVDVAIVDLVLKRSSGLDLARQIRAEQPALPIIIMSGYIGPQSTTIIDGLRGEGIIHVLTKPFAPKDLDTAIKALLKG